MIYTSFINYTNEELLAEVAGKHKPTELEVELAERLRECLETEEELDG